MVRKLPASDVFVVYLESGSTANKRGACASLLGSWLSIPIADPRNVLDHSLDYFHVLGKSFD